jgi:hypothetical protein
MQTTIGAVLEIVKFKLAFALSRSHGLTGRRSLKDCGAGSSAEEWSI